ncbi:MAG: DUF424 family protein [Thermoplasmata archaeon]|nr:DUF424 family protein [Thermoplasmata archaeon]
MISVRFYRSQNEMVLAACDEELLGRTFRDGKLKLEVGDFYRGEIVAEDALPAIFAQATNINLVGKRCIDAAAACGLVDRSRVLTVDGVPHAMVFYV